MAKDDVERCVDGRVAGIEISVGDGCWWSALMASSVLRLLVGGASGGCGWYGAMRTVMAAK